MFRTELPLTPHPQQLPLSARVLTIGSCFSETIGSRLTDFKVSTLVNPFGTVFNPVVACQLLRAAAGEDMDWQQHLVEARGRWQSYDLHASIGAASPVVLLQQIQDVVQRTGAFLAQADVVMLTLGTAFTYRLKETQELVNNCHKLPAERFEKEMLTPDEIINAVAETHAYLRRKNPKLRFVLTVSPVRHLKDTLPLNSVSKSVLRVACHYLSELLPDVSYFPAYELLLDDLRDYRFYASDMLHPSAVAEDYIWEKFSRTYFDANFGRFKKEWESVRQALAHRPLYEGSPEHRHFLETTLERMQRLGSQVDLRAEIRQLHKQIVQLPPPPKIQPLPEPEVEDDEERIDVGGEAEVVSLAPVEEPRQPAEEVVSSAAAMPVATEAATPEVPFKKKRRTRGGAKRNKNKKAAQLAALAAPAEAVISETPEPVAEVPEPTAPSAPTPAPHPALPPAVAKAAAMYEASRKAAAQEAIPAVLAAPGPGEVPPVEEQLVPAEPTPATNKRPARRTASQVRASANRKPRRPAKSTTSPEQPIEAAAPATPAPPVEAAPVAPFIASPAPEPAPVQAASEVPAKPKARRPARRATPAKEKKALPPPPKPKAVAAPSPPASDSGEPAAPKKRGRPPRKKPVSPDEAPQNS
ncbi:GSCFA domain-containing protein [Hymenobacter sp. DG25B]|uniref:GSCFA domain-containing protein n=1 Tax=Hymenobacter sp. DG25B TaxID=1385664 RepID=UPI000662C1D9|nr:GSCFA domain-containing protein [Hymenobacter sp. DG25B]